MNYFSIKEIYSSRDRYKLFVLKYNQEEFNLSLSLLNKQGIPSVNIGKEVAEFLKKMGDSAYLSIELLDFINDLLDKNRVKVNESLNYVLAIYNIGILLEPLLELDVEKLLIDFSKSSALLILWENQISDENNLHWPTQKEKYILDFSNIQLKKIQYDL